MMVKRHTEPRSTAPGVTGCPVSSFRDLTLLDERDKNEPAAPPKCFQGFPDQVYLTAAAVFQNARTEKPAAHRLINYGQKREQVTPDTKDQTSQYHAYELAFNALKYQELLEDIMIDSCFYLSQPMPDELMSLAVVMLYDFQDRKFLPRERPDSEAKGQLEDVREVENCLMRFKTKLAASLARCRIKHDLLTIECLLPEAVREKQKRARSLPLFAWVNTLKASLEDVLGALKSEGFSQVKSIRRLEGLTFCQDRHCQDLLVFPPHLKPDLYRTKLLSDYKLVIQDKSCSLAPITAHSMLEPESDVLIAGSTSGFTVAHMAVLAASCSGSVFACADNRSPGQNEELREIFSNVGCKNVKLLPESFSDLSPSDPRLQKTRVILLRPQCSASAISNPVDFILHENGDTDLLQVLSQGTIVQAKLDALVAKQTQDITHALKFSGVQTVVYCTHSSYLEENQGVVQKALKCEQEGSKLRPFRLSPPALPSRSASELGGGEEESFFRLDASEDSNGCFVAVLTREMYDISEVFHLWFQQQDPEERETAQEVLARAAAKGLLDGIGPGQPARKERRRRRPAPAARPRTRPHASSNTQSQSQTLIADFLSQETKGSSSAPSVSLQSPCGGAAKTNALRRRLTSTLPPSAIKTSWAIRPAAANPRPNPVLPTPPPRGRLEFLRPVALVFPPVAFPEFSSFSSSKARGRPPLHPHPTSHFHWKVNSQQPASHSSNIVHGQRERAVSHPLPWL